MNVVIIGNSAAGTAAIEAIRKHDRDCSIVQLTDEDQPLYSRCLLSYYLAGTIDKDRLLFRESTFHETMNVQLHAGSDFRVEQIDVAGQRVTCQNNQAFPYDKLLIATGASAKLPDNIPGDVSGIYVLRNLADAETIKNNLDNVEKAIVLGGGLIGIKAATALNARGIHTTVAIRSNRILSQMMDFDAALIISQHLKESGIDLLLRTDLTEVRAKNSTFVGITTDGKQELEAQLLITAKGVTPNTNLLRGTGIEKQWGIKTNANMQTNIKNIYAAGDVAETFDVALNIYTVNALWTCAIQQGRTAGFNMAGNPVQYNGAIGMNALNICDTSIISFGITTPKDESQYKILKRNLPQQGLYKKVIIGNDDRIKGIILLGKIENAGVLLSLIQQQVDVSSFGEELLEDDFSFGSMLKYSGEPAMERYYNS